MSAREDALKKLRELYVAHQETYTPWDKGCSWCDGRMILVEDILDAFARGLAERIRRAYDGGGPDEDTWIRNPFDAADLIDPMLDEGIPDHLYHESCPGTCCGGSEDA